MSDTVSFAELDRQHAELLPARTVLSMFSAQDTGGASPGGLTSDQFIRGFLNAVGLVGTGTAGSSGAASPGAEG